MTRSDFMPRLAEINRMVQNDKAIEDTLYKDVFGDSGLLDLWENEGGEAPGICEEPQDKSSSVLSEDSFFDDKDVDKAEEQEVRNQKARGLSWAIARTEDDELRRALDQQIHEDTINLHSLGREPHTKKTISRRFGMASRLELKRLSPLTVSDCPMHKITAIQVHPNGRMAIVSSLDNRLRLIELNDPTNPLITSFHFPRINPTSTFFSDNYKWLVITGDTEFYHIFDLNTSTDIKRRLPLRRQHVADPDLDYFLSGRNRDVRVLSMQSSIPGWKGSSIIFFSECSGEANYSRIDKRAYRNVDPGKTDGVRAGYGCPDAPRSTMDTDRYTFVYGLQLETNAYRYKLHLPFPTTGLLGLIDPADSDMSWVSGHNNENPILVVTGRGHGTIALIEFDSTNFYTPKDPILFGGDSFNITAMAISPVFVATGDESGFINIYRISDVYSVHSTLVESKVLRVAPTYIIKNLVDEIISMKFNPTSEVLAVSSLANETRFISVVTGKVFNIKRPPVGVCAFAFTPDLTKVFCGGKRGMVETYELVIDN